ncbi:MAG TPA: hypothetical protein VK995_03560 [Oceanipulchritudo sp.]|nr:hypothetical protein [Oceanipulchritudo sp.]
MSLLLNDQSQDSPKLRTYLNLGNIVDLPGDSSWGNRQGKAAWDQLVVDGYEGVQLCDNGPVPADLSLPWCGGDRVNRVAEADPAFALHKDRGDSCLTLHVGWGIEDDDEVFRLVEAVLKASDKYALPAFIETHRVTITQDMWRTVQITRRFPEVRFNGDFSHYYCGQEMVYGGAEMKMDFIEPIFARTGFLHGRIASPGCMQVVIDTVSGRPSMAVGGSDYLAHFREMWTRAMAGFLGMAGPGDVLVFAPEILSPKIYYARVFPDSTGKLVEESDRYAQAHLYAQIARECFAAAQARVAG